MVIWGIIFTDSRMLTGTKYICLDVIEDGDGTISVVEELKEVPFQIKRSYYIYNLDHADAIRGKHAHKELEEAIFCIKGSFKLGLSDGKNTEEIILNKSHIGVHIGAKIWHTMTEFSKDCIILVFASDYYRESDYLRDYQEYLDFIKSTE
jgi:dTDP-4-dehydrorhamnose 3,5-epimerase-like enzyme